MDLREALRQRILILDGAMGTAIQQLDLPPAAYQRGTCGCACHAQEEQTMSNEFLCLSAPDAIRRIHTEYIDSGADIITTNSFSANAISQKEYGLDGQVRALNLAAARLARQAADACRERMVWVAGSMGPTSKTLSLSTNVNQPAERDVSFSELVEAYHEQAEALVAGGVDLLLLETCFDALNAKAALYAISQLNRQLGRTLPVMVSATLNDRSGRTLTGQTLEAFYVSIAHYPILSFGINCSFGVTDLQPFVEHLAASLPVPLSLHPNAGLPNEMGAYDETPSQMAEALRSLARSGMLNIAGGCCGTTPSHIRAISRALKGIAPRSYTAPSNALVVAGLETSVVARRADGTGFVNIGERTNVAGSRKFARLIAAQQYDEALVVARHQVESGANIIDVNMDDAMLDSRKEMQTFLRYVAGEPAVARAALMIDSSDWDTIIAGLQNAQGKCIVNSISLKNGEADFLEKARELHRYGAAAVVMAFDEQGQATTYERKIAICQRAYELLTANGFPARDIIFDVNVLSVGTGIAEHNNYALDFIRAVAWIKQNLSACKTSGGISNLSFAFRGNNVVRQAMHAAFLYHAVQAGLDMAIVNPAMLQVYDQIDPALLTCVEDVILNRRADATDRLAALAEQLKNAQSAPTEAKEPALEAWRKQPVGQRLATALAKGVGEYLTKDLGEALQANGADAVALIEGPLMQGMEHVGQLFGEGKMFLPQVVKAAKVMKEAVTILQPYLAQRLTSATAASQRPKVVIATVAGDVHDIGKNIVGIVLACNNFEVIDLGVMVSADDILAAVREHRPLLVGVSGLITPSLREMERLCQLFEREGLHTPLFVGGATTSALHTAVKLAPLYPSGCVAYGGDASASAVLAKRMQIAPEETQADIRKQQAALRKQYAQRQPSAQVSFAEACRRAPQFDFPAHYPTLQELKPAEALVPTIADVVPYVNWQMLLHFWGFHGDEPEAHKTLEDARAMLAQAEAEGSLFLGVALRYMNATRCGNDILLDDGTHLPMLRSQTLAMQCLSLADYFDAERPLPIGLFCATAYAKQIPADAKSYEALMQHALCARLVEATAEWLQQRIYNKERVRAIRPAIGYPVCPDHALKHTVLRLTQAQQRLGVSINEHHSITPSTSVCALFIAHPEARLFAVEGVDDAQRTDYEKRVNS